MRRHIADVLAPRYRTAFAGDGKEALAKVYELHPQLIITDVMMPEMSGDRMAMVLQADAETADIPIVALTAKADEAFRIKMLESGVCDFIQKPFSAEELLVRLGGLLEERRVRETMRIQLSAIVESSDDAIIGKSSDGVVTSWNPGAEKIFGYTADEMIGQPITRLIPPERRQEEADILAVIRQGRSVPPFQTVRVCKDGGQVNLSVAVSPIINRQGRVVGASKIARDISERVRHERRLEHLARHDALTELPNRLFLQERLRLCLEDAPSVHRSLAVLFVDLDGFKHINDSLGHPFGDQVLRMVADAMRRRLGEETMIARLGGDEYVALIQGPDAAGKAETAARQLNKLFSHPLPPIDGHEIFITASIGVALFPDHAADGDGLLKCADLAMYQAKNEGRNTCRLYHESLGARAAQRLTLANALRRAIAHNELFLVYQPLVSLPTGGTAGAEALLRWRHPELGLVSPVDFIPVAEENGSIIEIGAWVLRESCRQIAAWKQENLSVPRVAVNLSIHQLEHGDIAETITGCLQEFSLTPGDLELEITESMAMHENVKVSETLEALNRAGFCLVIDDFGAGHSSLARLKQLPISRLKIDRLFIQDIETDADNEAIVRAVIALGHNLRLEVLAEGVERLEQAELLASHGCDMAQGFYFGRPMPGDQLASRLERRDVTGFNSPSVAERRPENRRLRHNPPP